MKKLIIGLFISLSFLLFSCNHFEPIGDDILMSSHDEDSEAEQGKNSLNNEEPEEEGEHPAVEAVKEFANIEGVDIGSLTGPQQEQLGNDIILSSAQMLQVEYNISSADLIEIFGSLDDPRIGAVGLILVAYNSYGGHLCNSDDRFIRCMVSAMIPCNIITTALDALSGKGLNMDAKTALGIMKEVVGSTFKTTSPIGIALMVAEFATCMVQQEPTPVDPEGDCLHIPQSIVLNEDLVLNTSIMYAYTAYHSHIGHYLGTGDPSNYGRPPFPFTYVFLNPSDSMYYMDSSFTKLLPDGYYIDAGEISSQSLWKYVRIENGTPIEIAEALNLDPYRCLETFDPATHLPFFD